jgi:hypothetical protein
LQEIYGYYTSFSFALPPSVMYIRVMEALKAIPHIQVVSGNETTLELRFAAREGTEYSYYLDLKIPTAGMFASVVASAKANEYSKDTAQAAADDIRQMVEHIRQNTYKKKDD